MCPGSPLGSSRPRSRGQTQAIDRIYPHPKTDSGPEWRETGWVGRQDRGAPPLGSHSRGLSPCTGGGGMLLALDVRAERTLQPRGWGSGMGEGKRLGRVPGTIALPPVLECIHFLRCSWGAPGKPTDWSPQAAQPHAIPSVSNSSPRFPPQAGRHGRLHIPAIMPPGPGHPTPM